MEDRCSGNFFCQAPDMFFLIWMGLAVFLLTIYHCVVLGLRCCLRAQSPILQPSNRLENLEGPTSIENSRVQLIQVHNFKKGMVLVVEDGMCVVCRVNFKRVRNYELYQNACVHIMHHALIYGSIHIQIALSAAPVLPSRSKHYPR